MSQTPGNSSARGEIWNLPEIAEYFRADPEIASSLTESDFNSLINYETDWVKLLRTPLEYQEFDPRVILHQLIKNRKTYELTRPSTLVWDLFNIGGNLTWTNDSMDSNKFTNQEPLTKDINFLIRVFLSRNNHNIDKILKKLRAVGDILNMLKEKYTIADDVHSSGITLGSRTITLPRIAGVFPATAVRMFHDQVVKEIVTYESLPGGWKPSTHAICCPLLPSVAPSSVMKSLGGNFHPAMLWVAIKLDDIIHCNDSSFTSIMGILSDYRAGYQSCGTPDKARVEVFRHLGLITETSKRDKSDGITLTSDSLSLAIACEIALEQMRTSDEHHDLLMKVAKSGDLDCF